MELDVEELDHLKRKLNITIPGEVVSKKVNAAYRELNRQLKMPGFRPGKIPQKILEKQIPVQSLTQVFQDLLQDYYEQALRETGITPAGTPEIDHSKLQDVKKDEPLSFSVTLECRPSIEVKGYKGLKFKKTEANITDEEVEEGIQNILGRYGHFDHCEDDHAVQKEDYVTLDFDGTLRGEPLENGSAKDLQVRIGENKLIRGFEDQLIGHKLGEEFDVNVILPANWNNKMRRISMPVPGADPEKQDQDMAVFNVKLKEIKRLVLPELTDELAGKEGFDTVEDLRRGVKTHLQAVHEQKEEVRIKEEIFNKLVAENEVEPPESLVQTELKYMIEGMKYQIEQSGMNLEDSGFEPEKAKEEWRPKAEFNTKGYMLLEVIAGNENIHITQLDLEDEYKKLAEQTKKSVEEIKQRMMANPESMKQTTTKLLGLKAMNYLYSHCEFEYVKVLPKPVEADAKQE